MSSSENPINENNPALLKSIDEFESDRTIEAVKFFHNVIKPQLKEPNKRFLFLTNSDISYKKWVAIWSNDTTQLNKLFEELTEKEDQKDPVLPPEVMNDVPKIVPIYTAEANDYYTDPETSIQHFPESIFNYDNTNYWKSIIEGNKELRIKFNKTERVKYLVIDFLDSLMKEYTFEVGYNTGQRNGKTGEYIDYYINDPADPTKRLVVTTELKDDLQYIEFGTALETTEIILNFISHEAGINYLFPIQNDLTQDALNAFLEMKS